MNRLLCVFGDSVVHADYIKNSWPDILKKHLEEKYKNDYIEFYNLGINGETTNEILIRLENELNARGATSVVFGVGVNDSSYLFSPSKAVVQEKKFASNLEKIIKISKEFTKDITFIGLVLGNDTLLQPFPGSSQGKSYKKDIVIKYDNLLKKASQENNCKYVYLMDKLNFDDFVDGLHPNEKGHRKMSEEIKKHF